MTEPYNQRNFNNRDNNYQRDFRNQRDYNKPRSVLPPEVKPLALPDDFVDAAEAVMRKLADEKYRITTSKLRNMYSLISDIYNVENLRDAQELLPASVSALTMARIRMVYEAGREQSVKDFLIKAKLLEYIKDIGADREKLIRFSHYMEALVAYHRYYIGGKEG